VYVCFGEREKLFYIKVSERVLCMYVSERESLLCMYVSERVLCMYVSERDSEHLLCMYVIIYIYIFINSYLFLKPSLLPARFKEHRGLPLFVHGRTCFSKPEASKQPTDASKTKTSLDPKRDARKLLDMVILPCGAGKRELDMASDPCSLLALSELTTLLSMLLPWVFPKACPVHVPG
jgi:hypothetical protein